MLKKTVLGLVTAAVLATTASANNYTKKLFTDGLTSSSVATFEDNFTGQPFHPKLAIKAYEYFKHMYITLVNDEYTKKFKGYDKSKYIWDDPIGTGVPMFNDIKNKNSLVANYSIVSFMTAAQTYFEYSGLPLDFTYSVQKIVNHTAITINLKPDQIVRRFGEFLVYLRNNTKNREEFNKYFQDLTIIMYYSIYPKYFDYVQQIGLIPSKTMFLTHKLESGTILTGSDFLEIILGIEFVKQTELSHNKLLAKLVNYILIKDYNKAVELIKNTSQIIEPTRKYLLKTLKAAAIVAYKQLQKDYILPEPLVAKKQSVKMMVKGTNDIINGMPEELKSDRKWIEAISYIRLQAKKITSRLKNVPNLAK